MQKAADLLAAVRAKNTEAARRLLDAEPALKDARAPSGELVVLAALQVGADEIARLLVERGARLDAFAAAALGEVAALEARLEAEPGAARAHGPDGWTALHLAAFFGREPAARLLIERGAEPGAISRNPTAGTPLHTAAARGHAKVAALLIERGAAVSGTAGGGWTPLHLAAAAGHAGVVALLIERGADLQAREAGGRTPLGIATATHHAEVAALLRRAGAA